MKVNFSLKIPTGMEAINVSHSLFLKKYLPGVALSCVVGTVSFVGIMSACTSHARAKINFVHKEAPKQGVVAKIGNEEITEETLIGEDKVDFFDLKKREYELKMARLEKLLMERLIGAEAKKAGMSLDDFVNKKVVGGEIKISDSKYKKFVAEKHIPEAQINPQIKERIINYLQTGERQELINQYIAKLTKGSPVEVYFSKPRMMVNVEAGDAPLFGKKDAPISIVEFSDFQCPFCARGAETVTQIKKKYGNKVKIAFKNFPLPMHKDAKPAAEAALCVHDQNADKFWTFHDLMFKNQEKLDKAGLEKLAKDAGVDVKKFNDCVASKKFADQVQKDSEYGEKIGVKSTPTFFINGQVISGAVPIESFSEIIDDELAQK